MTCQKIETDYRELGSLSFSNKIHCINETQFFFIKIICLLQSGTIMPALCWMLHIYYYNQDYDGIMCQSQVLNVQGVNVD